MYLLDPVVKQALPSICNGSRDFPTDFDCLPTGIYSSGTFISCRISFPAVAYERDQLSKQLENYSGFTTEGVEFISISYWHVLAASLPIWSLVRDSRVIPSNQKAFGNLWNSEI